MNKKKFNDKINNNSITVSFVKELFSEERKSLFNNEKIEVLIENNFRFLMEKIDKEDYVKIIEILYSFEEMHSFLERESTIEYLLDNANEKDFEYLVLKSNIKDSFQKYICNNFEYIMDNYKIDKIIIIYDNMVLPEEIKLELDRYFKEKKDLFVSSKLVEGLHYKTLVSGKENIEKFNKLIDSLVNKILEEENCKITDAKLYTDGGYCNVLCIGSKVIKVGIPRKTFDIPNDKRILQPYFRRYLLEPHKLRTVIEVSDRVDTKINLGKEEMYEIYKELRDRGIVYGDFRKENIGRLLKDNPPRNNVKNGFIGEVQETLKAGDYVILDTDYIYKEGDPKIAIISDLSKEFEDRYQKSISKKR